VDTIPITVLFLVAVTAMAVATELGYRLGRAALGRSREEKESPVAAISSTTLGLLAFILAFTFAIVTDRYDAKKRLVREQASAIRTAYARSEFLPEPDRAAAAALFKEYVDLHLAGVEAVQAGDPVQLQGARMELIRIQGQLWDMAVVNARKDMNSDVAALYVEALNEVAGLQAARFAIGWQARIPTIIWVTFLIITTLAMIGFGYHTAIAGSRRTWATSILVLSFSLMIALIAELDRPQTAYLSIKQLPMQDVQAWIAADMVNR
jgi:hypothetical protein